MARQRFGVAHVTYLDASHLANLFRRSGASPHQVKGWACRERREGRQRPNPPITSRLSPKLGGTKGALSPSQTVRCNGTRRDRQAIDTVTDSLITVTFFRNDPFRCSTFGAGDPPFSKRQLRKDRA
jgi:hypothetical protein